MDQGGELYNNPEVCKLFTRFGYNIRPTGADASNQNAPVECGHLVVTNAIRALLLGANLPIKFWPYAFHFWLRIDHSMASRDQLVSPNYITTGKKDRRPISPAHFWLQSLGTPSWLTLYQVDPQLPQGNFPRFHTQHRQEYHLV